MSGRRSYRSAHRERTAPRRIKWDRKGLQSEFPETFYSKITCMLAGQKLKITLIWSSADGMPPKGLDVGCRRVSVVWGRRWHERLKVRVASSNLHMTAFWPAFVILSHSSSQIIVEMWPLFKWSWCVDFLFFFNKWFKGFCITMFVSL